MNEIKIWAQMFFEDGSVSQGLRVPANILDETKAIEEVATLLLQSTNREEGWILLWGAGNMMFTSFSMAEGLGSLVSSP